MKSVLISIAPLWCHRIIDGVKKIEVRKTRPQLDTPFKVYIYCTAGCYDWRIDIWSTAYCTPIGEIENMSQNVIGEFVCDHITTYNLMESKNETPSPWIKEKKETCLSDEEALAYGKGRTLYGWHISKLRIYDKPLELSKFWIWKNGNDCIVSSDDIRPPRSWCYVEEVL